MEVLVEYDYEAQEADELTLHRGDIIRDVVKKQEGWWEGVLNDRKGLFPDNFVKVINEASGGQSARQSVTMRKGKGSGRRCRVIFSYHQDHEDELNLAVGDIIDIVGEEEEGWWRGIINGKEGVFPSNFVEEILGASRNEGSGDKEHDPQLPPALPAKAAKQYCEVKYAYKAQNEDELTLRVGDIVRVINKDGQDPGWWKGELNDRTGVFPDNFVVLLPPTVEAASVETPNNKQVQTTANKIAIQRKSLESSPQHNNQKSPTATAVETKTTPPVPTKKPSLISIKKSPSGSGGVGGVGLFSEIKRKLVDVVDGATGSKSKPTVENNNKDAPVAAAGDDENEFDQVERRPLLHDVRATRVKAPGRRPPTMLFKDDEDVLAANNNNNNSQSPTDWNNVELRSNDTDAPVAANRESLVISSGDATDGTGSDVKPKLREWEKHKAPWLEEMKLNQAKRTSVSPSTVKTTPPPPERPEKGVVTQTTTDNVDHHSSPSITTTTKTVKTPTISTESSEEGAGPKSATAAPHVRTKPSPTALKPRFKPPKPVVNHVNNDKVSSTGDVENQEKNEETATVPIKQYSDLVSRVEALEKRLLKQQEEFNMALSDLKARLQVETDMRIMMQAELDRVAQNVLQV